MRGEIETHVQAGTPAIFVELIWEEFFVSRGRGISLLCHAPFLNGDCNVRSIIATHLGRTAGGLIVKDFVAPKEASISLIGFVCVHPESRGQGLSKILLESAVEDAASREKDGLVLWTTTPEIYSHAGFTPDPRDVFVQVDTIPISKKTAFKSANLDLKPRGLPAFADSALLLATDHAKAIICQTPDGPIMCEWNGCDEDVMQLIGSAVDRPLWINAKSTDTLLDAIVLKSGPPIQTCPSRRMALPLSNKTIIDLPEVRILDRI